MQEKLPDRRLSADERERLTDAVLRLRIAARTMRHTEDSAAGADQQAAMAAALTDIEKITGIDPTALGDVLTTGDPAAGALP